MKKLGVQVVIQLAQGHAVTTWQARGSNEDQFESRTIILVTILSCQNMEVEH